GMFPPVASPWAHRKELIGAGIVPQQGVPPKLRLQRAFLDIERHRQFHDVTLERHVENALVMCRTWIEIRALPLMTREIPGETAQRIRLAPSRGVDQHEP